MRTLPEQILAHKQSIAKMAAECTLFLKRDNSFPLEKPCQIALYGSGARQTVKGGTGSGDVNCFEYNSCETALENAGFTVTTKAWLDAYDAEKQRAWDEFIAETRRKAGDDKNALFVAIFGAIGNESEYELPLAGEGEACVYVLARNSGEGNDRRVEKGNVLLSDTEVRDILWLNAHFEKFMLVLNVGGVVDISPVRDVKNILLLSQLGVVTGDVFVDILLGKVNPSGKLATTWAKFSDYQTIGDFGDKDDTRYKEGIYVGYRYFDTAQAVPLYPFGYGLSYTDFEISTPRLSHEKSILTVSAWVRNVGKLPGKEVVQVYVSCPQTGLNKPWQVLVAFQKTKLLQPGEKQCVDISFDLRTVASYYENRAEYALDAGTYIIRVGNSSRNTVIAGAVELTQRVVTEKVKNALGTPDFTDAVLKAPAAENISPAFSLSAADFETVQHDYQIDCHVHPAIRALPEEKLISMCIGAYKPKAALSVLGSSAGHVAGASGETSNYVHDVTEGKYLVLADGPAGLRISSKYICTENGPQTIYDNIDGLLGYLPKETLEPLLALAKSLPEEQLHYQDTTAIPIGTAIAQSWDPAFAEQLGNIVGEECELYRCHRWLAPAMNIHRSILCGRNFEYYSEDPLITGKIAAGMVRGLQKHPCIGATLKHFAGNNQEWNRYNNNSIVSERAMREIYLKGFEICVREAAPKCIMTSYNLINGEHTSQRTDLLNGILRGEWGYQGFVMTDWISTAGSFDPSSKHPGVYAHKVIGAGNDLMTPGADVDYEDIEKALADGRISRLQLEVCATRIYEAIMRDGSL